MLYEANPKHKEPWQRGRRGTLCPSWSRPLAQEMLDSSIPSADGRLRFGVCRGWAFAAREHRSGRWHGYPVAWNEVDVPVLSQWLRERVVKRKDVRRRWDFDTATVQALHHDD